MDIRPPTVRVKLAPTAGYCIKSTTLQDAICRISPKPPDLENGGDAASNKGGESINSLITSVVGQASGTLKVSKGTKVFVNIAWDSNVPPPPEGNEEMIQRAMRGEQELDDESLLEGGAWFVPVIVSEPRQDLDKAGKVSVVFDSVYNSSLKSRVLKDPSFKSFLTELALQRIEAQHALLLGRQIGTPNIASKGKLKPRTALIPIQLFPTNHTVRTEAEKNLHSRTTIVGGKKLIEEIEPSDTSAVHSKKGSTATGAISPHPDKSESTSVVPKAPIKSILKTAKQITSQSAVANNKINNNYLKNDDVSSERPSFSWSKEENRLRLEVHVPKLTRTHISDATLDIEARRVILLIPPLYHLDLNLGLPDSQIASQFSSTEREMINQALTLKRQKEFDVDGAQAEWRVTEKVLIILV